MRKIALSCGIGNALEWYDFVVYGYFVQVIGQIFFPQASSSAQLLMVFGSFAAGFIARPIGAIIFGRIGDKTSRKKALAISIYVMAIPTTLIGCLPTYEQVGILAPILLTMLRIAQGLAIGGEFTGSMIFLVEHAPKKQRGFFGSIATFSAVVGVIVGSAAASLTLASFDQETLHSIGWRLPFILSAVGGVIGSYIRKNVDDPIAYKNHKDDKGVSGIGELISKYKFNMLRVILLDFLTAIGFFIIVIFIATYFKSFINLGNDAQYINTFNMIVFALHTLVGGLLADKIGLKRTMMIPCILFILLSYPMFKLMQEPNILCPLLAQCCLAILMGVFFGAIPFALTTLFPISVRFSGISLAHNISMAIFGGTAPLIATFLITSTGDLSSPSILLIIAASLSLCGVILLPGRKKIAIEGVYQY